MKRLRMASGYQLDVDAVIKSNIYPSVYIYTNSVSDEEARTIFSNKEETMQISVYSADLSIQEAMYTGYTELTVVAPAQVWTGSANELLIWLTKEV